MESSGLGNPKPTKAGPLLVFPDLNQGTKAPSKPFVRQSKAVKVEFASLEKVLG